jgi:tRNA(Ile)-lysidine synthase
LIKKFKEHIKSDFPELLTKKVLVTVSGGVDSVTLLYLLSKIGCDIVIAHCNFKLRSKDSELDQQFVCDIGEKLQICTWVKTFDTKQYALKNKLSIQEAARKLRYSWFNELLQDKKADIIVTAHNLNDNFETVLHHLTRGTGLQGLIGIPPKNNKIRRPLLKFSRHKIQQYAIDNNIAWREDKSNNDTKYIRNKIRHKIIPVLQEINPKLLESFQKTQKHLYNSNQIIQNHLIQKRKEISFKKDKMTFFSIQKIDRLDDKEYYLYEFFKDFGFAEVSEIQKILNSQSGKQLFSKTHRLLKDRDFLIIDEIRKKENKIFKISDTQKQFVADEFTLIFKEVSNFIKDLTHNKNEIVIDKDLLKFPLIVRKWQKGDYFYPVGMHGKKKVSKLLKDNKLNLFEKENIWLLLSDNKIVWVIGLQQDKYFAVTDDSKNILKLTFLSSKNK